MLVAAASSKGIPKGRTSEAPGGGCRRTAPSTSSACSFPLWQDNTAVQGPLQGYASVHKAYESALSQPCSARPSKHLAATPWL